MIPTPSIFLTYSFVTLVALLCGALLLGARGAERRLGEPDARIARRTFGTAGVLAVWLVVTAALASTGILLDFDRRPPPLVMLLAFSALLSVITAFSGVGARLARGLPFSALIGFQVFRWPLEMILHRAYTEGVMPVEMSYSGRNLDIVTGISAGLLGAALLRGRTPRWTIWLWNIVGFGLLVNIVTVAILCTPLFRFFDSEPPNVWVGYVPFVWLPTVFVQAALLGHLLVLRKLLATR